MINLASPAAYLVLLFAVAAARQQPTEGSQMSLAEGSSGVMQSVLLDTTEQSSLGWTKYPDGGPQTRTPGWVEESFTNFERGINWRSFVVCDVAFNSVNNWLWTPFIERGEANRLYIEIKFTMRDCNLFPQMVLSCKETFALLYKEMDSPIQSAQQQQQQQQSNANASFAQSDSYTLIDTIAADEGRFTSSTDVVINTEIRSIPVSKRGVYFAFRDQGACLSLISIKVYHLRCPALSVNLAQFNATPTGRDLTSLVAVEGSCAANSLQLEQPKMFCSADGNWNSMSSGQCKCLAGFEPARNNTKCQACAPNTFKATLGELPCQSCPDRSSSGAPAATECRCHEGFFRAPKDPRSAACSQPPGPPSNLSLSYVDSSSLILQWQPPRFTGYRDDLSYKLVCLECDQQSLTSSPSYFANFSETKCVLAGLQPSSSYRFLVYAMNGVSQLSQSGAQYSEISLQTGPPVQQSTRNTLSGQGGFQLTPIYNMRALPGARGTDMVLAWDAQPLAGQSALSGLTGSEGLELSNSVASAEAGQQLPSLYEIRYQPRHLLAGQGELAMARRSPYPASLLEPQFQQQQQQPQLIGPQTVATTNRALVITTLVPRTEYAFQIRAKWAHSSQWSEFSEPIYMATSNQAPYSHQLEAGADQPDGASRLQQAPYLQANGAQNQASPSQAGSWAGWLSTLALFVLCALIALSLLSLTLVHLRKSACLQSLAGGFGTLGTGSTYGGVYGSAVGGPLAGFGGGGPLSPSQLGHGLTLNSQRTMLGSGSAGPLITGSNATSRSSSGAGNAVQNFIAATLSQISGGHQTSSAAGRHAKGGQCGAHGAMGAHTMGAQEGKLFAANGNQLGGQQRNHYHQTMSHHHTMLLHQNSLNGAHFHQLPVSQEPHSLAQLAGQTAGGADPFKYRTLGGQQAGAPFMQQQDPQMHIYDDLDTTCSSMMQQRQQTHEIDPQQVIIKSVLGRGEFGDVCLGLLRNAITGMEHRVAVKTLKAPASDKAKLDFLVEASIMCQFEHPNIIRLEGVVTKSEPPMIVTEFMENGALDSYLRENKNRFSCLQLISMLRGIASGMQYLAKLNYVHKDLAGRNILVNEQKVCKIADFGLSAHQTGGIAGGPLQSAGEPNGNKGSPLTGDYINSNDSSSTNSSNTLSSQTTGSTPTTASTMAGGCGSQLSQLQGVAEQLAQQRFSQQQAPVPSQPGLLSGLQSIQNPKIPVRWTALEAIAFRRFTSASDVWSFGVVCWEVMTEGERPYWNWSNQDVIKAVEQGYRLPQPESCPEALYKMMLDCWLKERAARPTFGQILKTLDRLLSPYDDPFCGPLPHQLAGGAPMAPQQAQQSVPMHTRISANQGPAYYDSYNPISQLLSNKATSGPEHNPQQQQQQQSVGDWLDSIKMSKYREHFQRHQISSLAYAARLSQADLNLIGIQNNQHVKKILNAIAALRSASSIGASGEGYLV